MGRLDIIATKKVIKIGQRIEIIEIGDNEIDKEAVYNSRIEDIKENEISIALPIDYRLCPIIPARAERIRGRIVESSSAYEFTATYKNIANIPIPVWVIEISDTVEKCQNREFVRVKLQIPLKITPTLEDGSRAKSFKTTSIDLSGNGLSFITQQEIPLGSKLILETSSIAAIGRISIFIEVKRCFLAKDNYYVIGSKFVNLPRITQNKLVKYLFTKQREIIAKGVKVK